MSDIERAVGFYESVGIGPWQQLPRMRDLSELDGPAPDAFHTLKYTWTTVGDLQLQLVQPGAGSTPQGAFLEAHGDGVFHIGFAVDSVDDAEAQASALGLEATARAPPRRSGASRTSTPTDRPRGALRVRSAPARC